MRRIFAGFGLLAVIAYAGYGGLRWYQSTQITAGEATTVLQIPREMMARHHLFERSKGTGDGHFQLADDILEGTLSRLQDRQIDLQSTGTSEKTQEQCLLARCRATFDSNTAGQERVTLTYHGPTAAEAMAVLTAIVDTLREIQTSSGSVHGDRTDAQSAQLTILSEREEDIVAQIKDLDAALSHQKDVLETQGLSEIEQVVLPEQLKRLGVDLAEARRNRLEAEHRLIQTKKDLAAGLPVSVLMSRLPGNDARDAIQKTIERTQPNAELGAERAEYERLSRIYGPRHPRMVELQKKIDALQAAAANAGTGVNLAFGTKSPTEMLQRLLAADLEERQALENDLQEQFDARKGALDQQSSWLAAVARLQKELPVLQEERDSLRRKIVEARRQLQGHAAEVLVPPEVVERSVASQIPLRATIGFVGGLALATGLYLQRLRRRARERDDESERIEPVPVAPRSIGMSMPVAAMHQRTANPSPLAALLATRKIVDTPPPDSARDKADRAARLARLKSLTQSPVLAPHSV